MPASLFEDRDIAIVAFAETKIDRNAGATAYQLAAEIASELVEKSGVSLEEIDGLAVSKAHSEAPNTFYSNFVADYLALAPRWLQASDLGGASAVANVARAAMALKAGLCEWAMLINADAPSTINRSDYGSYRSEFWHSTGIQGPPGAFGLLTNRYQHEFELDPRGLGALAVAQRKGAVANPLAYEKFRKEITIEDYLASRMVSSPLRLLDSVMFCDGANGLLMTRTETARKRSKEPLVYPLAYRELTNYDIANQLPDITQSGFSDIGPQALADAGMSIADIQQLHPYDDFLIAVMLQLEHLGFCKRGQGSQFLRDTDLSPTGTLPVNTGGGQIGAGQVGLAGGGTVLVEAVRQLQGKAEGRQVPDPRNAMVTGLGVMPYGRNWGSSNVLILAS